MADTASLVQRLLLSATDLKILTSQQGPGEPWPDALIEDYLNILRDLVTLADIIDENSEETIVGVSKLYQITGELESLVSKLRVRVNRLEKVDKKLEQLIYAW